MGVSADVRWLAVDDELVIFVPGTGAFVDLDASATDLFSRLLRAAWQKGSVAVSLHEDYGVTLEDAAATIDEFCVRLLRFGVIQVTT